MRVNKFLTDTNVLIRLIVKDDEDKFRIMMKLAKKVENHELTLIIPTVVIAECCWLLKSFYQLEKSLIKEYLTDILQSVNVEPEEEIVIEALRLYAEKNIDFADALLSVKSSSTLPVLTWDKKDFKRLNCEYFSPNEII
ncbi:PIN domain-containing protein [Bacillus sp. FJAT-29937]|uniref:PIN domain-containing protein n=1 Tax=Bacillus sp. FJAT-29937 TaxID=1720553 RepID=UPI00082FB3CB|nr:PIN domain-containing protein [Bacillus sp. FJAT-29937]